VGQATIPFSDLKDNQEFTRELTLRARPGKEKKDRVGGSIRVRVHYLKTQTLEDLKKHNKLTGLAQEVLSKRK